jgi:hypothetical protein
LGFALGLMRGGLPEQLQCAKRWNGLFNNDGLAMD